MLGVLSSLSIGQVTCCVFSNFGPRRGNRSQFSNNNKVLLLPLRCEHIYKYTYEFLSAESARLVHPWHFRGRTTCGTVQLFFGFLIGLCCFCFCSFCQLFLDLSAASCKFGFSAKHDFEPFRDYFFLFV